MGRNRWQKRRRERARPKASSTASNPLKLHIERLEERWLLDSAGLIVEDPFSPHLYRLPSVFQLQIGVVAGGSDAQPQDGLASGASIGAASQNVAWDFAGPSPLIHNNNANGVNLAPNFGAGAIEAIAVNPANTAIVYVGTVAGGVWRTLTADQTNPFWEPLTDFQRSLNISSIAVSPVDINPDGTAKLPFEGKTIYAGTGSFSSGGASVGDAIGVMRSTDGVNFEVTKGSGIFAIENLKIRSIVPLNEFDPQTHKQIVLVAAIDAKGERGGIYRSNDAGETFRKVSIIGTAPMRQPPTLWPI